jgi:hypothetical protein
MVAQHTSDVPAFGAPDVVKLQADHVAFSAIDAGVLLQVGQELPLMLCDNRVIPQPGFLQIVLFVGLVVPL